MKVQLNKTFEDVVSVENLLLAWKEFVRGKRGKRDVQEFQLRLMDNIFALHGDLRNRTYRHGPYQAFSIQDPKHRDIHKATVRDRLLHHALYRVSYPFFDRTFIADSYSCRVEKGTHRAFRRFSEFTRRVSRNHTRTCWVLKCDVRKFFASIDQGILVGILDSSVPDPGIRWLCREIIESFSSAAPGKGLPLGNLTSQLLVNIYMNEFDQFVKHRLKARCYIRYADDFVLLAEDRMWLEALLSGIAIFLERRLKLALHPSKVSIRTVASGIDFLGWIHFPDHRVLRTSTKRRMLARMAGEPSDTAVGSYLGLLKHGNTYGLQQQVIQMLESTRG